MVCVYLEVLLFIENRSDYLFRNYVSLKIGPERDVCTCVWVKPLLELLSTRERGLTLSLRIDAPMASSQFTLPSCRSWIRPVIRHRRPEPSFLHAAYIKYNEQSITWTWQIKATNDIADNNKQKTTAKVGLSR